MSKSISINDGFSSYLVKGAEFAGSLEMPVVRPIPPNFSLPHYLVPFSLRKKIIHKQESGICFYEHDNLFTDLVINPDQYVDELRQFNCVISPDNSLYRDMPLCCQILNIYRSRVIGSYLQRRGVNIVTNIRWGDERTFSRMFFDEPPAFQGAPHNNTVAIGTYGCIKSKTDRMQFRNGLLAMLHYLTPTKVLVYGKMPCDIFGDLANRTSFVAYNDWTSMMHAEARHGN